MSADKSNSVKLTPRCDKTTATKRLSPRKNVNDDDAQAEKEDVERHRKAAANGGEDALFFLGRCYQHGRGVPRNRRLAARWFAKVLASFRLKAGQGDAWAQNRLGDCYLDGYGVAKDEKLAVKWYRKAAEQGYCLAQFSLGSCYQAGRGVPKNKRLADKWIDRAMNNPPI